MFKKVLYIFAGLLALGGLIFCLLWKFRPELFQSGHDHKHCILQTLLALKQVTSETNQFPNHPNGYGDALLLLIPTYVSEGAIFLLNGHGYSDEPLIKAYRSKTDLPEEKCGRVYVQGLNESNDSEIVLLFDKNSYGGGREAGFIGGHVKFIKNDQWPAFAEVQIKLLIQAGIPENTARSYYQETLK
jgi:hypothetical protein